MSPSVAHVSGAARRRARRGLAVYFAVVVALSVPLEAALIAVGLGDGGPFLLQLALLSALMVSPTLASVAARLALREGFADISLRTGGRRGLVAVRQAVIIPVGVAGVAYGAAAAAGLIQLIPPPPELWVAGVVVSLILNALMVPGEEIGWRGYMLTRLIDAGAPRPVLVSGLVWGLWHVPLVLWAGYASGPSPALSAALLLGVALGLSYVAARMRLETGSVWPAVALHVAWNVVFQAGFHPAVEGAQAALWVGEAGALTVIALAAGAALYARGPWAVRQAPGAPPVTPPAPATSR